MGNSLGASDPQTVVGPHAMSSDDSVKEAEARLVAALDAASTETVNHVLRLVDKMLANPTDGKYRRLKRTSGLFRARFCGGATDDVADGVPPVLAALGFEASATGERVSLSDAGFDALSRRAGDVRALVAKRLSRPDVDTTQAAMEDDDDDEDLAKALAMSVEETSPPPEGEKTGEKKTAVPTKNDDSKRTDRASFEARLRRLFEEEVAKGTNADPNAAAARAMERLRAEDDDVRARRSSADSKNAADDEAEKRKDAPPNSSSSSSSSAASKRKHAESEDDERGFERMESIEKVAEEQMAAISMLYGEDGVEFVDPSFPPAARSLYEDPKDADFWKCVACGNKHRVPREANGRENVIEMLREQQQQSENGVLRELTCSRCGRRHPLLEVGLRPCDWLRPRDLRDDLTFLKTRDPPWTVFRDEPRADDVRQGAVGNCWFVCALSVLAEIDPSRLRDLVATKTLNPAGAYQIRLNLAGVWHVVTIDDTFPVNALECAAYLKPARRSLWAPLVEKAAAKLYGSYEALAGGSFAEAFGLLTGFPVRRVALDAYRRTPLLLVGNNSEDGDSSNESRQELDAALKKHAQDFDARFGGDADSDPHSTASTELFAQIYSMLHSKFAVGASTFVPDPTSALEAEMRSLGLQTRHAYGVLEARSYDGELLVKLRNPNGVALWRGAWARSDSTRWTPKARRDLGLDGEDRGVFWMRVDDVAKYFAELTVCRVLPDRVESRASGWLASIFGPGQAVKIEAYSRTDADVAVYQEPHKKRGERAARNAVDLGLALVKLPVVGVTTTTRFDDDEEPTTLPDVSNDAAAVNTTPVVVASAKRQIGNLGGGASLDAPLELDSYASTYLCVPLCFGHVHSREPRKFALAVHSAAPVSLEVVPLDARLQARAVVDLALKHGQKHALLKHPLTGEDALAIYALRDDAGYCVVAENLTPTTTFVAELDVGDDALGFVSTRGSAARTTQDLVPPRTRLVLAILSRETAHGPVRLGLSFAARAVDDADLALGWSSRDALAHVPSLDHLGDLSGLHEPIPIDAPRDADHDAGGGGLFGGGGGGGSLNAADLAAALRRAMGGGS